MAQRWLYHSTPGSKVIKKKKIWDSQRTASGTKDRRREGCRKRSARDTPGELREQL